MADFSNNLSYSDGYVEESDAARMERLDKVKAEREKIRVIAATLSPDLVTRSLEKYFRNEPNASGRPVAVYVQALRDFALEALRRTGGPEAIALLGKIASTDESGSLQGQARAFKEELENQPIRMPNPRLIAARAQYTPISGLGLGR